MEFRSAPLYTGIILYFLVKDLITKFGLPKQGAVWKFEPFTLPYKVNLDGFPF